MVHASHKAVPDQSCLTCAGADVREGHIFCDQHCDIVNKRRASIGLDPTLYPVVGKDQCAACGTGPLPIRRKHCDKHCNFVMRRRAGSQRVCAWCGQSGKVRSDRSHCDRDCLDAHYDAQSKSEGKECRHCGKIRLNRTRMFCNIDCSQAHFTRPVCAVPSCGNIAESYGSITCSKECGMRWQRIQHGTLRRNFCFDCGADRGRPGSVARRCADCAILWRKRFQIFRCEFIPERKGYRKWAILYLQRVGYPAGVAEIALHVGGSHTRLAVLLAKDRWNRFLNENGKWSLSYWDSVCRCGRHFHASRWSTGKYCGQSCSGKYENHSQSVLSTYFCAGCGEEKEERGWRIRQKQKKNRGGLVYCSFVCGGKAPQNIGTSSHRCSGRNVNGKQCGRYITGRVRCAYHPLKRQTYVDLTDEDRAQLVRIDPYESRRVRQRISILELSDSGLDVRTIAMRLKLHVVTIRKWIDAFNKKGVAGLFEVRPRDRPYQRTGSRVAILHHANAYRKAHGLSPDTTIELDSLKTTVDAQ